MGAWGFYFCKLNMNALDVASQTAAGSAESDRPVPAAPALGVAVPGRVFDYCGFELVHKHCKGRGEILPQITKG